MNMINLHTPTKEHTTLSGGLSLGVLGKSLPHTLSPEIHQDLLAQQNISAEYKVYEMSEEEVTHLTDWMTDCRITGLNVTIPYKETVYHLMDVVDSHAEKIGAINTIYQKNGKFYGYNTDYIGAQSMFAKAGVSLKDQSIVILGSGGAAKALIYGFHIAGASQITVAARNQKELLNLKNRFPFITASSLQEIPSGDILVNTTPLGMFPNIGRSVVDAPVIQKFRVASDIVYNPLMTEFLHIAKQEGLQVVTGLMMLVDQAIASEEIWLNKKLNYQMGNRIHNELAKRF
ncbi:MAG: shikimate dehydrogenase [Hespellia sp.]|jgi:shikimate dehydrogenase|nr:shikimate dehydrogenase [Hespellia sp.]